MKESGASTPDKPHRPGATMTPSQTEYRLIPLTNGHSTIVDAEDYTFLMQWKWKAHPHKHVGLRAARDFKKMDKSTGKNIRKTFLMHRVITNCPDGLVVDHINGDMLDNRRENLRVCTSQENRFNSKTHMTKKGSKFKGVHKNRDKWRAVIMHNRKYIHIGNFLTPEEAARAYDAKALELFGEFAHLNFPKP